MKRYIFIIMYCFMLITTIGNKAVAQSTCGCNCVKPFFDYLISSNKLFITQSDSVTVSSLIANARAAGFDVTTAGCPILQKNLDRYFYALTSQSSDKVYKAMIGDCSIVLNSVGNRSLVYSNLKSDGCDTTGKVIFRYVTKYHKKFMVTRSVVTMINSVDYYKDTAALFIKTAIGGAGSKLGKFYNYSIIAMDSLVTLPSTAFIVSSYLHLFAYPEGFSSPTYPAAHSLLSQTRMRSSAMLMLCGDPWTYSDAASSLALRGGQNYSYGESLGADEPFQDYDISLSFWFNSATGREKMRNGIYLTGLNLSTYGSGDTTVVYGTFCSERYPDVSKHPYLDLNWYSSSDTATVARLYIDSCSNCNEITALTCYSAISDTSVNPYLYGLAGNWRPFRTFSYYNPRTETNTNNVTNTRSNGTVSNFIDFWQLVNGKWQPQDTAVSRWVWTSESTLFNQKGAEMENLDPMGRYTTGLFGYQDALATAVAQNARYREIAYDGFEDYNYVGNACDSTCSVSRNFDFSAYKSYFDTTVQHTGNYSLRLDTGMTVGISSEVTAENSVFNLTINKALSSCSSDSLLKSVRAGKDALLPSFSPMAGKKIVVSTWVRESGQCNGINYTGSQVQVYLTRTGKSDTSIVAKPTGNIIEGWQRIEMVVEVPANAGRVTIGLQNTGKNAVYFDDLRVHPYNANMKSYVYDESSLRLMAELDENNYATFYEYDDDGSLIRIKKETERGIMTIKESRSAMLNK